MGTSQMRQRLHNYLEVADDKKLKALYAIMEDNINESAVAIQMILKKSLIKGRLHTNQAKKKPFQQPQAKKESMLF